MMGSGEDIKITLLSSIAHTRLLSFFRLTYNTIQVEDCNLEED
jgi:hypothetical protein